MNATTTASQGMRLLGIVLFAVIAIFGVVALFTNDWSVAAVDLGIAAIVVGHKRRQ